MRHWHWLILSLLLVPMGATVGALIQIIAYPLTAIFSTGHDIMWYFTYIVIVQLIAIAWVLLQIESVRGGNFMNFVASLPVSNVTHVGVNLTLLVIANSILLLMLISAVFVSATPDGSGASYRTFAVISLFLLTLIAQLATLEKTLTILSATLVADLLFASSFTIDNGFTSWLLIVCAIAIAILGITIPSISSQVIFPGRLTSGYSFIRNILSFSHPIVRIQIKALANYSGHTSLRIGVSSVIAIGTVLLIPLFEFDSRSLPTLVLAMAVIAFILGGVYRTLHHAHVQMQSYSLSLPLGKYFWVVRDTLFVIMLGTIFIAILFLPVLNHLDTPFSIVFFLCMAFWVLLALLRLPLLYGGRQSSLLYIALVACWSGAVFAVVL